MVRVIPAEGIVIARTRAGRIAQLKATHTHAEVWRPSSGDFVSFPAEAAWEVLNRNPYARLREYPDGRIQITVHGVPCYRFTDATQAVMVALTAIVGRFTEAGESCSTASLEAFTRDAKAYLGDKSELSTETIERADYSVPFAYFKEG